MSKALSMARILQDQPPLAVQWTKVSLNKILKEQFNLIMDASIAYEMVSMASKDRGEAVKSFLEKRKPVYKGM